MCLIGVAPVRKEPWVLWSLPVSDLRAQVNAFQRPVAMNGTEGATTPTILWFGGDADNGDGHRLGDRRRCL